MDTVDATPHASVGDRVTLSPACYPFVKLRLRTNTRICAGAAQTSVQLLRKPAAASAGNCARTIIAARSRRTTTRSCRAEFGLTGTRTTARDERKFAALRLCGHVRWAALLRGGRRGVIRATKKRDRIFVGRQARTRLVRPLSARALPIAPDPMHATSPTADGRGESWRRGFPV